MNNLSSDHRKMLDISTEYNQPAIFLSNSLIKNFFKLWIISTTTAALYSHIIINIDQMESPLYQDQIKNSIKTLSSLDLNFKDCTNKNYNNCLPLEPMIETFEFFFESDLKINTFIQKIESMYATPSLLGRKEFIAILEDIEKSLRNTNFSYKDYCLFYEKNTHIIENFINEKFKTDITTLKASKSYKLAKILQKLYHYIIPK